MVFINSPNCNENQARHTHWLSTRFGGKWCRYEYFSGVDTIFLSLDTRDSGVDTSQ